MKHGFSVVDRNYWKKWGEIDIVAKKAKKLYFVEVKSVSCEIITDISHETCSTNPAENVTPHKLERLHRVIQSYLMESRFRGEWEIFVLSVHVDEYRKTAHVERLDSEIYLRTF